MQTKPYSIDRPTLSKSATINIRNLRLRTYIGFNPEKTKKANS